MPKVPDRKSQRNAFQYLGAGEPSTLWRDLGIPGVPKYMKNIPKIQSNVPTFHDLAIMRNTFEDNFSPQELLAYYNKMKRAKYNIQEDEGFAPVRQQMKAKVVTTSNNNQFVNDGQVLEDNAMDSLGVQGGAQADDGGNAGMQAPGYNGPSIFMTGQGMEQQADIRKSGWLSSLQHPTESEEAMYAPKFPKNNLNEVYGFQTMMQKEDQPEGATSHNAQTKTYRKSMSLNESDEKLMHGHGKGAMDMDEEYGDYMARAVAKDMDEFFRSPLNMDEEKFEDAPGYMSEEKEEKTKEYKPGDGPSHNGPRYVGDTRVGVNKAETFFDLQNKQGSKLYQDIKFATVEGREPFQFGSANISEKDSTTITPRMVPKDKYRQKDTDERMIKTQESRSDYSKARQKKEKEKYLKKKREAEEKKKQEEYYKFLEEKAKPSKLMVKLMKKRMITGEGDKVNIGDAAKKREISLQEPAKKTQLATKYGDAEAQKINDIRAKTKKAQKMQAKNTKDREEKESGKKTIYLKKESNEHMDWLIDDRLKVLDRGFEALLDKAMDDHDVKEYDDLMASFKSELEDIKKAGIRTKDQLVKYEFCKKLYKHYRIIKEQKFHPMFKK